MKIDPFRLESDVIQLGRDIARRDVFHLPVRLDAIVRQTLLVITACRIKWEASCDIVNKLLVEVEICKINGEAAIRIADEAVSAAADRHRHPLRYKSWLDSLFAENGRLLLEIDYRIRSGDSPSAIRRDLVRNVPGFGPKAASLLLRNFGLGESLAVLDVHILDFMRFVGLLCWDRAVTTIASYESLEEVFVAYARFRRIRADALDLAAWIIVRNMKERRTIEHRNSGIRGTRFDLGSGFGSRGRTDSVSAFC